MRSINKITGFAVPVVSKEKMNAEWRSGRIGTSDALLFILNVFCNCALWVRPGFRYTLLVSDQLFG